MASLPSNQIPWQAIYTAWLNGTPEEELAQVFNIALEKILDRKQRENWEKLRQKLPMLHGGTPPLLAKTEARLKLIEENRMENLKVFSGLRKHLIETVEALAERRLKMEKHFFASKAGIVVSQEVEPSSGDWVNIATYARTIAEGTYRALGDFQAQEKPGQDASAGATAPQPPAITIILPGAIAAPREDRAIEDAKGGKVIDLRPLTESPTQPELVPAELRKD